MRSEAQQVLGERAHVGRLIKGEDAAVADHAANFGQRIKIERRVEQAGGQDATERAADLHRLDLRAVLEAAGDLFAKFTHGQAKGNLNHSGVDKGRVKADELRASRIAGAQVAEGCSALRGDKGNVAERLNVVDDGWLLVDAALSRERRAGRDGAAQPLQAGQQRSLFANDVRAGAFNDRHVEAEVAAENVVAEQVLGLRLLDRFTQDDRRLRVLGANEHEALVGADGVTGQREPFEQQLRRLFHQVLVDVGAGVALIAVGDDVLLFPGRVAGELPLVAGREGGAAAATQVGGLRFYLEEIFGR